MDRHYLKQAIESFLSEDIAFGDLTAVKGAVVDALVGYYHTRVAYPGFPGAQAEPAR